MEDHSPKVYVCDNCKNMPICKFYDQMVRTGHVIEEHCGELEDVPNTILELKCDAYTFQVPVYPAACKGGCLQ